MPFLLAIQILMPAAAVTAALFLKRLAAADSGPTQPECAGCGVTEISWVAAVCVRWARVQGRLLCPACLRGFPEWMHSRI